MTRTLSIRTAMLVFAAVAITGCKSTITGNEGNLEFSYWADDEIRDFNKPIAVGAKLDIEVHTNGTHQKVDLLEVTTEDPSVLKVAGKLGNMMTLEGVGEGTTDVTVEAKTKAGETVSDWITMRARKPNVLKAWHSCTQETEGIYLVNHDIAVGFDLRYEQGSVKEPVIGYGYHPITIEPAAALALDQVNKDQQHFHFKTAASAQTATLTSTIDSTALTFRLVEEGAIDGASFAIDAEHKVRLNADALLHVLPTVGGKPVCQSQTAMSVEVLTADVCSVQTATNEAGGSEAHWIKVSGKALGTCNVEVTFPKGANGAGASAQLSVEVVDTL
ncbi:MAG: hypothetical protein ACOX6T_16625 [Myxococcales bacterium]|jgi:hypothetical protein